VHNSLRLQSQGPDAAEEDRLRYDRVIVHGPVWDAALRDLWDNSELILEDISLKLYVQPRLDYKVKIQAERLGLRFPRQVMGFRPAHEFKRGASAAPPAVTAAEESEDALRERHRAAWLEALRQNPDAPRTLLREKHSRVYKWLARRDGDWLASNLPPPKDHSFDWAGVDFRLAREVREAAAHIYTYSPPTRITVYAIGRYLDRYDYLRHRLDRLPLTRATLNGVLETPTVFARRVQRQAANAAHLVGAPSLRITAAI
jgi:hypothetical protein